MTLFRKRPTRAILGTDRVEAFSDGVFAVAVTLLVLGLAVPTLNAAQVQNGDLLSALSLLWPKILSFFISFGVIGIFWVGHHIMFHYVRRVDRNFLWLNILFLSIISFFPFAVALIGQYSRQEVSILIYGLTLMVAGLVFGWMWLYASARRHLVDHDLPERIIKLGRKVVFMASLIYAIAILVSFVSKTATLFIYILVPVIYIWPSPIDELIEDTPKS